MRENTRRQRHREVKKKGFIISFGDIILPVVGIIAIGLLVIAGKLFFSKGVNEPGGTMRQLPEIGSRQADAAPLSSQEDAVPMSETEPGAYESSPESAQNPSAHSQQLDLLAIPYGGDTVRTSSPLAENNNVTVTSTPVASQTKAVPQTKPKQPQSQPAQQQSSGVKSKGRTVSVKPQQSAAKAAAKPSQSAQKPAVAKTAPAAKAAPQWRVQVGAYGSRDAANEIVSKLSKSGYTSTIFASGRFFKVWVQAGATKQAADSVMSRLKRGGFPDSYLVPPASKN